MDKKTITEEQIAQWKQTYKGEVYEVTADDKTCYLRKPDRTVLSLAATLGKSDPIKYSEILVEKCWLGGDTEMKTQDEYFFAVAAKAAELVKVKEAEIKKL